MRPLYLPALTALLFVVLPAASGFTLYRSWISGSNGIAEQLPARVESKAGPSGRCPQCGRIEGKRKLLPDAADPIALPSFEYTVRMADGSSMVFREQLPVSWRVGEPLIYIDAAQTPPAPVVTGIQDY